MLGPSEPLSNVRMEIPSDRTVIAEVVRKCGQLFCLDESGAFPTFAVVLRELLMNAIEHGNKGRPERLVYLDIERVEPMRVRIRVEDQGEGFDHRSLDLSPLQDPRDLRSRGYLLVDALADSIEFNDPGNVVTVYMRLAERPPGEAPA